MSDSTNIKLTLIEIFSLFLIFIMYSIVLLPYYYLFDFINYIHIITGVFIMISVSVIYTSLKIWWKYRGKYVSRDENPYLHEKLENLSSDMNATKPKLVILDSDIPNAYATDSLPARPIVILTTSLLNTLEDKELDAVIAHEISHINSYDIFFMTVLSTIISFIRHKYNTLLRYSHRENTIVFVIFTSIPLLILRINLFICRIVFFIISRVREYMADNSAAEATSPVYMKNALIRINQRLLNLQYVDSNEIKEAEPLCIVPFVEKSNLFRTHPQLKDRIENLEKR